MFRSLFATPLPAEDQRVGQALPVAARWMLILAGLLIALWNAGPLAELRVQIGALLLLAVANFFLHARILRGSATLPAVAWAASAADLLVVTVLIATQGGQASPLYVFYLPALLALALALPAATAIRLAGGALGLYALIGLATAPTGDGALVVGVRILALGAVLVCALTFARLEREHRQDRSTPAQESLRDVFFGQVALNWARWAVVAAGALVALAATSTTEALAFTIAPVILLMGLNFFLHGRYVVERPANPLLLRATSVLDLAVVALLVVLWRGDPTIARGLDVLYAPLVVAFALVFPPRQALGYVVAATGLCLATSVMADAALLAGPAGYKILLERAISLGTLGGLSAFYWRLLRGYRRATAAGPRWQPEGWMAARGAAQPTQEHPGVRLAAPVSGGLG